MTQETVVEPDERPPHSPRQVLLGFFILFQLLYLILSNSLGYLEWLPREFKNEQKAVVKRVAPDFLETKGHGWHWRNQIDENVYVWTELTGQHQNWSLFAPTVNTATGFPAVLLSWDDDTPDTPGIAGTVMALNGRNGMNLRADGTVPLAYCLARLAAQSPWALASVHAACALRKTTPGQRWEMVLSDNEPRDIYDYVRFGNLRLRRFEGQLYINPEPYRGESADELAQRMNRRIKRFVRETHGPAMRYLQWRLASWQRSHPDRPAPEQVVLVERFFRIHGPAEPRGWDGPNLIPLARWQPARAVPSDEFVLQPYDFVELRFDALTR